MSGSKQKQTGIQPATRSNTSLASKLASMAATSTNDMKGQATESDTAGTLTMSQLVSELAKQRTGLLEDMTILRTP